MRLVREEERGRVSKEKENGECDGRLKEHRQAPTSPIHRCHSRAGNDSDSRERSSMLMLLLLLLALLARRLILLHWLLRRLTWPIALTEKESLMLCSSVSIANLGVTESSEIFPVSVVRRQRVGLVESTASLPSFTLHSRPLSSFLRECSLGLREVRSLGSIVTVSL